MEACSTEDNLRRPPGGHETSGAAAIIDGQYRLLMP
jgi:hypothetical protein